MENKYKKTETVSTRLTKDEKAMLNRLAEESQLSTGDYVNKLILDVLRDEQVAGVLKND